MICALLAPATLAAGEADLAAAELEGRRLDERCAELERAGHAALAAGDPARALEAFERLAEERRRSSVPALAGQGPDADAINEQAYRFLQRVEGRLLGRAVALQALARRAAGQGSRAEELLATPEARIEFSGLVAEQAFRLFQAQRWDEAATAYALARTYRLGARNGAYDVESGRLQYNEAMARFGAGGLRGARELLVDLSRRLPDYRPEAVAQALDDMQRMISSGSP